jgi:hypothetical protein
LGKVCYIKADKPGGPRYDPSRNDEERQSFDNLILMSASHHTVVDDYEEPYTVERLRAMKSAREGSATAMPDSPDVETVTQQIIAQVISQTTTTFGQTGGTTAHTININNNFGVATDYRCRLPKCGSASQPAGRRRGKATSGFNLGERPLWKRYVRAVKARD